MNSPDLIQFLEVAESAVDRSTFYNKSSQQEESVDSLHNAIMSNDRELYILSQGFSGLNYYNRLIICRNVIFNNGYLVLEDGSRRYDRYSKMDAAHLFGKDMREADWRELENEVILKVWASVPVPKLVKEWMKWREKHLNNTRSRKLILRFALGAKNFPHWAMVYRKKLLSALSHAWGESLALSIMRGSKKRNITPAISKYLRLGTKSTLLEEWVERFIGQNSLRDVCEGLAVIAGDFNVPFTRPEYIQRQEARKDPSKIAGLPLEVALGLSGMHKDFNKKDIYESKKTQATMSSKQKVRVQRAAQKTGATVEMNLASQNVSSIIRYGYERGFDRDVTSAITSRIKAEAKSVPGNFGRSVVVVDNSASAYGSGDRKYYPIAASIAVAFLIKEVSDDCEILYTNPSDAKFPRPGNDTDLAGSVLQAFQKEPDVVWLVSDGYENVSAGTLDSILRAIRDIGNKTPLVHLNPVFASESSGVRKVSELCLTHSITGSESLPAMYEKLLLASSDDPQMLMKLKKYLLDKLDLKRIPSSIVQEFAQIEASGVQVAFKEKLLAVGETI